MIDKSHRWHKTALAAAAAAFLGLWGSNVAALSLGRITIQSALGEQLRAEIEVPEINAEEAASLKAAVALPDAFRAAGLEYNPAMSGLQVTLQRRPDGRAYFRLSSDRTINDPFVDMILEVNWATGRIVRDYTMLFDPPSLRQAAPSTPTQAQVPSNGNKLFTPAPAPSVARAAEPAKIPVKPPSQPPVAKATGEQPGQVNVKNGDTASKIAAAIKPANVSLDQMLVAMLRANPAAFIGDNINRVKSGTIMNIPTAAQAEATPAAEAAQIIVAQSKDFNDFRRKLASNAPTTQVAAADRTASGSVQTKVEDKKSTTATPDKLTLSKGAVKGQLAEDALAKDRSAKEATIRAAEIAKNISDLNKLGAASNPAAPSLAASAISPVKTGIAVVANPVTAPLTVSSAPVEIAAPTPTLASSAALLPASAATVASAPKPAASAVAKRPAPIPVVPQPEPSFLDGLLEDPVLPAGAAGLIALLAGLGFYKFRQRKNATQIDSSFLESRLQPDSFFGASGGQSIDTNDGTATGSSMVYSPSQLDAVDDVDPVAEADVYLAYGRDLQAEEILKDALRTNPQRIAIHQKLLEIFAKRRDLKGFESIAILAFKETDGQGNDWDRICEFGLSIDPTNALYQPGGQPISADNSPSRPAPLEFSNSSAALSTQPNESSSGEPIDLDLDLDLDLDFSLDEDTASAVSETTANITHDAPQPLAEDFGMATVAMQTTLPTQVDDTSNALEFTLPELDLDLEFTEPEPTPQVAQDNDFGPQTVANFGTTGPAPLELAEQEPLPTSDLSMLEFDLGSLSLELEDSLEASSTAATGAHEDPLGTKLALAEEFRAIGDDDGARALIEEVISEATGDMKLKAQRALNNL